MPVKRKSSQARGNDRSQSRENACQSVKETSIPPYSWKIQIISWIAAELHSVNMGTSNGTSSTSWLIKQSLCWKCSRGTIGMYLEMRSDLINATWQSGNVLALLNVALQMQIMFELKVSDEFGQADRRSMLCSLPTSTIPFSHNSHHVGIAERHVAVETSLESKTIGKCATL